MRNIRYFSKNLSLLIALWSVPALGADADPGFETQDISGTTTHENGTIGTTPASVPAVAGNIISELIFRCPSGQTGQRKCLISFDAGVSFFTIGEGEFVAWSVKGSATQVMVKASVASTSYEMLINFEAY